jgi:hypothetical protein
MKLNFQTENHHKGNKWMTLMTNDPYDKNKVRGMGMNLVNWELEYLLMKLTTWMIKIHMGEIQ